MSDKTLINIGLIVACLFVVIPTCIDYMTSIGGIIVAIPVMIFGFYQVIQSFSKIT